MRRKQIAFVRSITVIFALVILIVLCGCGRNEGKTIVQSEAENDHESLMTTANDSSVLPVSTGDAIKQKKLKQFIKAGADTKVMADSDIKNILIIGALMTVGFSEIPLMLRFKNQNKAAIITLLACAPILAAFVYFAWKFTKFCMAEATRLYGEATDETMAKVFEPYFEKARNIGFIAAPFFVVGVVALFYVWALKEYRRRRY